ncbi:MOB kinase activator 3A isoform X1 [Dendrobates tinctorius]|uniref:MOB kinase activator 3A isoform X1 n=1 Tax=Dendrobates tinctorius TaxID=92724 RepID=UPI003CC9734C
MANPLKQVFNKDRTFRPKRKFEPGTQRFELHKKAQASLNAGLDLKLAVQLPHEEDQNDWVAVHVVDFFNRINLIYGTISDSCTEQSCPVMSGGPKYEYRWQDENRYRKPTALSAPKYMNLLMDWIEVQINNEGIFPTNVGTPFPKNFLQVVKKMLSRLFRVFVHVYIHHFDRIIQMGAEAHVNTCYKHFYYFVTEFNLIDTKELEPLDLGWIINIQKSRLVQQSLQMFLGFQLNSITQKCLLPQVKIALTKEKVEAAIDRPRMSLRGAMSLLGSLDSCASAVRWAHYHVRTLQHQILQEERRHGGHLESKITLTQEVLTSLEWWLDDDHLSSGVPWVIVQSCILTTDASPQGWGAHMGNSFCQGRWNREEREYSSNLKELTAVYYALHHFLPQLQQKHVRILSDNTTTVAYINRQGGTRSETLMSSAARILSLAESYLLSLSALHIRGENNQEADFLSRHTLRQGEWCLSRQIFQDIVALWGHPQVDLFATRENRQTKTFASLSPADHPDILDALQASWKFKLAYAFPPLILLPQVIRKIREDKARVILIAPFWPKRPWFSWLRIMSVTDPWVLPSNPNLLSQGPFFHPQVDNLHLTAWNLKGTY